MSAGTDWNMEFRQQQQEAMEAAKDVIAAVDRDYGEHFGRSYGGLVEMYRMDDAELCLVAMGSVNGTIKDTVDELRKAGQKVGLVKLRFLRPFPTEEFRNLPASVRAIGIIDRDISFGYEGAVGSEVKAALKNSAHAGTPAVNFIAGIAGRDITKNTIRKMFDTLGSASSGNAEKDVQFMDMRW